jgi:hypothetical protein
MEIGMSKTITTVCLNIPYRIGIECEPEDVTDDVISEALSMLSMDSDESLELYPNPVLQVYLDFIPEWKIEN